MRNCAFGTRTHALTHALHLWVTSCAANHLLILRCEPGLVGRIYTTVARILLTKNSLYCLPNAWNLRVALTLVPHNSLNAQSQVKPKLYWGNFVFTKFTIDYCVMRYYRLSTTYYMSNVNQWSSQFPSERQENSLFECRLARLESSQHSNYCCFPKVPHQKQF